VCKKNSLLSENILLSIVFLMQQLPLILYKNDDGNIAIDVVVHDKNVWLTQEQMAALYGKAKSTINEHIKNIYDEKELLESQTLHKFGNSEFMQK
jgi:hypothetical protein